MSTLGPALPVAVFDNGGGTVAWVNPGNASATDGVFATMTGSSTATVYNEIAFNTFSGFTAGAIPAGATINGVQIDIKGLQSAAATWKDTNVALVGGASGVSSNQSTNNASTFGTSNAVVTYGGPANLIGGTWAPGDFVSGATVFFDIAKAAGATSQSFSLDSVAITVTYTPLAGGAKQTLTSMGCGS